MSYDTLFNLGNLVMPFWLLMIVLPFWKWTERIMRSPWVAIVPAAIYVIVIVPVFGEVLAGVSSPTLDGIAELLSTPQGALLGWVHFLAFDLLVGRWAYLDSRQQQIPWWLVSPILFFVLMAGPLGFVLYLILRTIYAAMRGQPVNALLDPA